VMETESDELVQLTDDFISSVCQDIHNRFPKVKIDQGRIKMEMSSPGSGGIPWTVSGHLV
jgi:hypothetical protein